MNRLRESPLFENKEHSKQQKVDELKLIINTQSTKNYLYL